jgi:hypothetical protein
LTFTSNMHQSSPRTDFLDILLEPKAIAVLASIALHAAIGASLPFFTQPEKEGKKAGPTTVKVLELTPSELQRIPQIPQTPTVPVPQASPPVAQPTTTPIKPQPSIAPSPPPKFSTSPQAIPFSPIRLPKEPTSPKPRSGKKEEKTTPQKQTNAPNFDPGDIFKPSPTPSKSPIPKGSVKPKAVLVQPSPQKTPSTKTPKATNSPAPQASLPPDDDGGNNPPTSTPAVTPRRTQLPTGTPASTTSPTTTPKPQRTTQSSGDPNGGSVGGSEAAQMRAANSKLQEYLRKYPDIKVYESEQLPPQVYKSSKPCPKVALPPFIVLMVAFDKVPGRQDIGILGDTTSPLLSGEKPYINGDRATLENTELLNITTTAGFAAATKADRNRPEADRNRPVLYRYRVTATCQN